MEINFNDSGIENSRTIYDYVAYGEKGQSFYSIDDGITWEDLNDPKKSGINKEKLDRKIIQFYCMENMIISI